MILPPRINRYLPTGDARTANTIVKRHSNIEGLYIGSGFIDWDDSGFYPAYYECTTLTHTLSLEKEDDWYLYLPCSSISGEVPYTLAS